MKITRHKRVQRCLGFYKNNFGFRKPYQVLIDGTFCQAALKCKLNIHDQMPSYLNDEVKLMTTACVITETEKLGPMVYGAMLVVKQYQVRKCGHEKNPILASDCLLSMVKEDNTDHYFIATQDPQLSEKVRKIPAVPLLYIKYNAIILEKPSSASAEIADVVTTDKFQLSNYHGQLLKKMKKNEFGEEKTKIHKKRKMKGPNPLSCKKKKKKVPQPSIVNENKRSRKRRHKRIKISHHITDTLSQQNRPVLT